MAGLSIITLVIIVIILLIIAIIELLISLSPFILGWIGYSYMFSKLIYSFAKRYLNINIPFSKTWAITFLSGMTSFIIDIIFNIIMLILFIFYNYISIFISITSIFYSISLLPDILGIPSFVVFISIYVILSVILGIPAVFITSLIAYKYRSNVNLRKAIIMSFATLLAYLTFIIIVIIVGYIVQYLYNILFPPPPKMCCAIQYPLY
jgi:hypothetical protein